MQGERILIVCGDDSNREALAAALADTGRQVRQAEESASALYTVNRFSPQLVIIDVDPPHPDGLDLLKGILLGRDGVDAMLLSTGSNINTIVRAKKIGVLDILWKPLDLKDARVRVERAFTSRRFREHGRPGYLQPAADEAPRLIGRSAQMLQTRRQIVDFASTDVTVLILGPTGTGKELAARLIHECSERAGNPFVAVNCAAVTPSLLESELFGHVKGAFTGAEREHRGRFEQACGGTIFLDEIGDATLDFQAKLLRVLQDRTFHRVGGETERTTNARVTAATNQDLAAASLRGGFRMDLLHRLAVAVIEMPSLREYMGDLGELVDHLLRRLALKYGLTTIPILSDDAMDGLRNYDWPGNVRELESCLERGVVRTRDGVIYQEDLRIGQVLAPFRVTWGAQDNKIGTVSVESDLHAPRGSPWDLADGTLMTLEQAQAAHIEEALRRTKGNVNAAARLLGVPRSTLRSRMERLAIGSGAA